MLYDAYEMQRSLLTTAGMMAGWGAEMWRHPAYGGGGDVLASALEVFAHSAAPRGKPAFGIDRVTVDGQEVTVTEEVVLAKPFGQLKRFRREGELLATLNHPHIMPIYGMGEVDGELFLVMEWVDGVALDQVMEQVRRKGLDGLPPELAALLAIDVLKVRHVIVVGHSQCGGVAAALEERSIGLADNWIRHVQDVRNRHSAWLQTVPENERVNALCELNVVEQALNVCHTTVVREAWQRGQELVVHGWVYRLHNGLLKDLTMTVTRLDDATAAYERALAAVHARYEADATAR